MLINKTCKIPLTKKLVDSLCVNDSHQLVWDTKIPAFGIRVTSKGTKTYVIRYRPYKGGRHIHKSIGRHGVITLEQARNEATKLRHEAWQNRLEGVTESVDDRPNPTISELCDRYLREHSKLAKKKSSRDLDRIRIKKDIKPNIGGAHIRNIKRHQIAELLSKFAETPAVANQIRALLSHMFNKAEEWGLRDDGSNPVRFTPKSKVKARTRYLTEDEHKRLGQALLAYRKDNTYTVYAVLLIMLTGCRKMEILSLKWQDLDLPAKVLALKDSKTGSKTVPLGDAAIRLIEEIPKREGSLFVFPGRVKGQGLTTIQKGWDKIRKAAGMPELRIHDLRRNFGTVGNTANVSLHHIGGILGHSQTKTTESYAQRVGPELVQSADLISGIIEGLLQAPDQGEEQATMPPVTAHKHPQERRSTRPQDAKRFNRAKPIDAVANDNSTILVQKEPNP